MSCMPRVISLLLATAMLAVTPLTVADQRPDHFAGESAVTIADALSNLSRVNAELETLLSSNALSPQDLHEIHQLTYTLENALGRLGEELERSATALESVHLASELTDPDTVREQGAIYLEAVRNLIDH